MYAIIWLVLLVVFLIVEAFTVATVSLWFAGGALAALLAALVGGPVWLQAVLFLAVSAVLLACLRPLVRKHFTPKIHSTYVDAVVGRRGVRLHGNAGSAAAHPRREHRSGQAGIPGVLRRGFPL